MGIQTKTQTDLQMKAKKVIEEFVDLTLMAIDEQKKRPFKDTYAINQLEQSVMSIYAILLNRGDRQ
ncbi:hypothetical protein [Acetonema longum]|uniref:Uncharacterized protein n=1 Tax=Acetonema longum DSM 6540 TaxID=1009370 RepID=F7NK61_9FIRM|nr:hypothetical protein [Acetonema longum]EGO63502.1 hypothetical protein ALO_12371 [Acetonema longum DSM 6540]